MRGRFLKKTRKTVVMSSLTLFVIGAQLAPSLFSNCTNEDIASLINSLPSTVTVVQAAEVDKNSPQYTWMFKWGDEMSDEERKWCEYYTGKPAVEFGPVDISGDYDADWYIELTNGKGEKVEYSEGGSMPGKSENGYITNSRGYKYRISAKGDGNPKQVDSYNENLTKYVPFATEGKWFYTLKGKNRLHTRYPNLVKEVEKLIPTSKLWERNTMCDSMLGCNATVYDALGDKEMRKKLAAIGRKELPNINSKTSDMTAAMATLATYFGVINDDFGLDDLIKFNPKKTISRNDFFLMSCKYWRAPADVFENGTQMDSAWAKKVWGVSKNRGQFIVNGYGKCHDFEGISTKREAQSSITRLEVIYAAIGNSVGFGFDDAKNVDKKIESIFSDVKVSSKNKIISPRKELTGNTINWDTAQVLYYAYKQGVITPDSKGRANLRRKCTQEEALAFLFKAADLNGEHDITKPR